MQVTNECPRFKFGVYAGQSTNLDTPPSCTTLTFPDPAYASSTTFPKAAPLLGPVAYMVSADSYCPWLLPTAAYHLSRAAWYSP